MIKATFTWVVSDAYGEGTAEDTRYGDCPIEIEDDIQAICEDEGIEYTDLVFEEVVA